MKSNRVPRAVYPILRIGWLAIAWLFSISPWALAQIDSPAPALCETVYAVHDEGSKDSQFFRYQLKTDTLAPLGPLHKRQDIESLSVDPFTHILYATSGQPNSVLYTVDADTGEISGVGEIGFDDVVGLAFHPEGSLWGWAKQGLVEINSQQGTGTLMLSDNRPFMV
jgi:hypothetical protein